MSLFRRIFCLLSPGSNSQTSADLTAATPRYLEPNNSSPADAAGDPGAMPPQQTAPVKSYATNPPPVDSTVCEDEPLWSQAGDDDQSHEPEYSSADGTARIDDFQTEVDGQDHIDSPVPDFSDNDNESQPADRDRDHIQQDADHVYLQDQLDPGFDDICQLPPLSRKPTSGIKRWMMQPIRMPIEATEGLILNSDERPALPRREGLSG